MKRCVMVILFTVFVLYLPFSLAEETKPVKYTFIVGNYLTPTVVKAIKNIWVEYPYLKKCIDFELISKTDLDSGFDSREIEDSDVIVIDIMGIRISTPTQAGFDREVIKRAMSHGARILPINNSAGLDKEYMDLGLIYDAEFRTYFDYGGIENFRNMVLFSLAKYANISEIKPVSPMKRMKNGYYHRHISQEMYFETFEEYESWYKKSGYFKENAPWVAVLTYASFCEQIQNEAEDDIIRSLEDQGFNAFVAFGYPEASVVEKLLLDAKGNSRVSGLLSFLFRFSDFKTTTALEKCGVPVINLITVYGKDGKGWENDQEGLSSLEVSWQLAIPEIAGLIQPTVVSYRIRERDDETAFLLNNENPYLSVLIGLSTA